MNEPPVLTTGQPSTLGVWRDNCARFWGEESASVKYFDTKIADSPNGRDEWLVADEHQMILVVWEMERKALGL